MKQINSKISRTTTTIALVLAIIVTIFIPAGYFGLQYQNLMGRLDVEVEINSSQVSKLISDNPELWRYESLRLDELLSRRPIRGESRDSGGYTTFKGLKSLQTVSQAAGSHRFTFETISLMPEWSLPSLR